MNTLSYILFNQGLTVICMRTIKIKEYFSILFNYTIFLKTHLMGKKKEIAILGVVAAVAIGYFANKIIKKGIKRETSKAQGITSFKEKDYKKAIEILSILEDPDFSTCFMIYQANEKTGNLSNALVWINRCIKIKKESELFLKRHEIHKALDLNYEAFKDLFILSMLNKNGGYKEIASGFLKKYSMNQTKTHKISGWASSINFSDFFENIFFLNNLQDPLIVFINSKEYEKCYEFVKDSNDPLHQFILGCLHFVNGHIKDSAIVLEKGKDYPYSKIFLKFIKAKKLKENEIDDLKKLVEKEEDTTVLYFMSRIFEAVNEMDYQCRCLDKLISLNAVAPVFNLKIISYFKRGMAEEAAKLIEQSLKSFPDDINLICISLEYFIAVKDMERCQAILRSAENAFKNDPRIYLFKFMESEANDNPEPEFLKTSIRLDDKYFKPYIYLGNSLSDGEECARLFKKALDCARIHDEIFTAYQLLTVVEAQNDLFNDFPELFVK